MNGISILICTHNGAKRLPETLRHIAAQQVPLHVPWEVIVISNASQDDTLTVVATLCQQLQLTERLRTFEEPVAGKEHALTLGFSKAHYEGIVIVDDDNWLSDNYIHLVFTIMQAHPEIGILGGYAEGAFEVSPPKWFERFQAVYAVGPQNGGANGPLPSNSGYLHGAGSIVRKSAWEKLVTNGFRFTTSAKRGKVLSGAEDLELGDAMRLAGYKLWYDDRLRFKHFMFKERLTWAYLMRLGRGTASSPLTSLVYFFIFRHPHLTEAHFKQLYKKHLAWLAIQIARQPINFFNTLLRPDQENLPNNFDMMRLLYTFRALVHQQEESVKVFYQVRSLQERLTQAV